MAMADTNSKERDFSEEDSDMFSFRSSTISNPNFLDESTNDASLYPDLPAEESVTAQAEVLEHDPLDDAREELKKTEEEIETLRQVLNAKVNYASELRKKLGMTPLSQISQTFKQELNKVQSSNAYQSTSKKVTEINDKISQSEYYKKTSETLKSAGQSTASALTSFGSTMSQKLTDMNFKLMRRSQSYGIEDRNSQAFKSFEEKVEGVGSTIMAKVSGSSSEKVPETVEEATEATPVTTQPHQDESLST